MKILILQDFLRNGGTERQSCFLANAFAAAGHTVTLMTFRPGGVLSSMPQAAVNRISLQARDSGWDWYAPSLTRAARDLAPDIVLCMGRMANCYGGLLASRLPDTRVVATLRTGKALPWLFRRSLRRVAHVVANSEDSRSVLLEVHRVPQDRVSVIHNAIIFPPATQPVDEPDGKRLRLREGVAAGSLVMLWVGMFRPEKNQRELIEIVSQLPRDLSWQVWFVGDGVTLDACRELVKRRDLTQHVRLFGYVDNPSELYRAADLAALTSTRESLSNFLIESHAHGLPSVAYDVTGARECGGIVIARGDQQAFRETISRFLRDRVALGNESDRVRRHAQTHFSSERQTASYLELFARLAISSPVST